MAGYFGTKAEAEAQVEEEKGEGAAGKEKTDEKREDGMTAEGELCFTFSVRGKSEAEARDDYLRQMDRLGYKIGLRLRTEQDVRDFRFRRDTGDVRMAMDPAVTADLTEVLGAPPGERWLGFLPDSRERRRYEFPEPGVICYRFLLRVVPRVRLPLLIPMVIRHDNGRSFRESFIGGLLTIRPRTARR